MTVLKFEGGAHDGRVMDVPDGVPEQILEPPANRLGKTRAERYQREKRPGQADVMVCRGEV